MPINKKELTPNQSFINKWEVIAPNFPSQFATSNSGLKSNSFQDPKSKS